MPRGTRLTPHRKLGLLRRGQVGGTVVISPTRNTRKRGQDRYANPRKGNHGRHTFKGFISNAKSTTWVPVAPPFRKVTEIILSH